MQTLACWDPASTVHVLPLSLIRNMWGPMWSGDAFTSRSVRIFTSSSPCCVPGRCSVLLCLSSGVPWKMLNSCRYGTATLRKEAQILESQDLLSVTGQTCGCEKGKLDCPGLLDRTVDTICSADTRDHCAITVHSSFVATWELVHMLITNSVPDIVRQHLHFNQTCQRSVSMLRLEKSSSVLFLH